MNKPDRVPHAHTMSHEVLILVPVSEAFHFVQTSIPTVFQEMARGHELFCVRGGGAIEVGAIIDCRESCGPQSVVHEYQIIKVEQNQLLHYRSDRTEVEVHLPKKDFHTHSTSYVTYQFEAISPGQTTIRLTISIQLANAFIVAFNRLIGGFKPWEAHCAEELENLGKIIESRYSGSSPGRIWTRAPEYQ